MTLALDYLERPAAGAACVLDSYRLLGLTSPGALGETATAPDPAAAVGLTFSLMPLQSVLVRLAQSLP